MIKVVNICNVVRSRLSEMDYEKEYDNSPEQLIYPNKNQKKGNIERISEQELRLVFIEEFKKEFPNLFYSIETPTQKKYKFGKTYAEILNNTNKGKRSAALDMCIFETSKTEYKRILNIEFKHKNTSIKNIAKDILKLICEEQNGAFIHLLNNTNSGTFCNRSEKGIFNNLYKSFSNFNTYWKNNDKIIQIVIFSLEQKTLIHRVINKTELNTLKEIFYIDSGCGNIKEIKGNGWCCIN